MDVAAVVQRVVTKHEKALAPHALDDDPQGYRATVREESLSYRGITIVRSRILSSGLG